jgi:hypothetical protein
MDYAEDMMCVVERRNPNNVVTLSHGFPGYHDLCNIVTISATRHITLLFSREFGDDAGTFPGHFVTSKTYCKQKYPLHSSIVPLSGQCAVGYVVALLHCILFDLDSFE